jgi:hypothetical protein
MKSLDKALDAYYKHFGENFPIGITECREEAELISEIKRCLETNVKAEEPVYEDGYDY